LIFVSNLVRTNTVYLVFVETNLYRQKKHFQLNKNNNNRVSINRKTSHQIFINFTFQTYFYLLILCMSYPNFIDL